MCDGPRCEWCGIPLTSDDKSNVIVHTKDGRRIEPVMVKPDFSVLRYDDGSPRYAIHPVSKDDKLVHKGECNQNFVAAKQKIRTQAGAA